MGPYLQERMAGLTELVKVTKIKEGQASYITAPKEVAERLSTRRPLRRRRAEVWSCGPGGWAGAADFYADAVFRMIMNDSWLQQFTK